MHWHSGAAAVLLVMVFTSSPEESCLLWLPATEGFVVHSWAANLVAHTGHAAQKK